MTNASRLLLTLLLSGPLCAAAQTSIIPLPAKFESGQGAFYVQASTRVCVQGTAHSPATAAAIYFAEHLRKTTGYALPLSFVAQADLGPNVLLLTTNCTKALSSPEGYELTVSTNSVVIGAFAAPGFFYGTVSLLELLPPEALGSGPAPNIRWSIPACRIEDEPRFAWRGFLLDVARHFFTKAELKEVFDMMALHKLNTFQWHLTDDQGWRVEIKSYPRLTEVGAWRKGIGFGLDPKASSAYGPDGRYGGFYTQDDVRELVAYAAARHITIVPEIEMPGHAGAALAAYPELSCLGGPYNPDEQVLPTVLCAGKDQTFDFLQSVLREICELFPGKYIHVGGDEVSPENWKKCPNCLARRTHEGLKNEHELESYLIARVEKMLNDRGRTLVGWSEIREGGLARNATMMDWIGGSVESAREGHDVVMTPTAYCYLDYYQATNAAAGEPKAIGGYLPLQQVYAFEPVPATLDPQFRPHIIGAQANLWTEFVPSLQHLEYMALPRLSALAEVAWSPAGSRSYEDFLRRLQVQARRFDQLGLNYRRASIQPPS